MLDRLRRGFREALFRFSALLSRRAVSPGLGLGLPAVFVAIRGDFYARGAVNWVRFRSGRWKTVARQPGRGD